MRLFAGLALLLVGIAFAQAQLVIPQTNNLNAVLSLLPQLQGFADQLNTILPQLVGVLSSSELQSLKDKIVQVIVGQLGNKPDLNAIKDKLRPVLEQFLGSKPQARLDIDNILQQIAGTAASLLPGIILGLLGKRDAPVADARSLDQILALADKFQLNAILPQVAQLLSPDKLQQLQSQFFATVVTALGNNWNMATVAQMLQQLVTQFVPQAAQMRIDWESIGQSALNGLAGALPGIAIGLLGLLGKREAPVADARSLDQILALADKFQLNAILPQVAQLLSPDQLQQLQSQFFATVVTALGNNWNMATVAQMLQQLVTQFVPQAAQMRIDWESIGQSALNGLAGALPGIAIGLLGLLGKRDAPIADARSLDQILALADKFQLNPILPQVAQLLSPDKLQELQSQFFATVVTALGNNWNMATVAQMLQQLVTQFVPQAAQMRIDWESIGQSALNGLAGALPGIAVGLLGLLGKREAKINLEQLLAQLPVSQLAQLVQAVTGSDKAQILAKLRQLLQQFFPAYVGRVNFDDLAANLLNHLNNLLPGLSQSLFGSIFG